MLPRIPDTKKEQIEYLEWLYDLLKSYERRKNTAIKMANILESTPQYWRVNPFWNLTQTKIELHFLNKMTNRLRNRWNQCVNKMYFTNL
jgi:hypothetical protein